MKASEWMGASVGVSFHWTSAVAARDGRDASYQDAVNAFAAEGFADRLRECGARHCILTLTHAEQYLAFPCEILEKLLPGRTCKRDLIGEIAQALSERDIRFIAYYNHSCNGDDDPTWKRACGYAAGKDGDLDAFARNICCIVECIAKRYGEKLDGWWFDSAYSVDSRGPHNTISCDMGDWNFPWQDLIAAAKSGNAGTAVAINPGIGSRFLYAPNQDYYAGESVRIDEPFSPEALPGIVDHRWICMDNPAWAYCKPGAPFADPRFGVEEVTAFVRKNLLNGRMTTFNMEIDRFGEINPKSLAQFASIPKTI
ncbi:MAG: alpha-L-fucosidase [Christensenellales bacterium]|jgi:hypothetical protein